MEAYFFTLHGEKITYNLLIRKKYIFINNLYNVFIMIFYIAKTGNGVTFSHHSTSQLIAFLNIIIPL